MPSTTITAFSAQMSKGFARPNLFRVEISTIKTGSQADYQMRCFQAQIPGHNIATTDKDVGLRSIAYQKIYSDIILGFYVSGDSAELQFWQEWIDRIVIRGTPNRHNYYNNYIGQIKITQENRFGHDVATWTLHDAYPKQIDPIQLDYGSNDSIMTCNATITYRYFTVKYFDVVKKETEQTEPQYAISSNTDLNKIDPMLEIEKEGWKFGREQMSEETFIKMYPTWDNMNQTDRLAARKLYGLSGDSKSGGVGNSAHSS